MAASLQRLTLYALIIAVETDFRALLSVYAPDQSNPSALFDQDMLARVAERAQRDGVGTTAPPQFVDLVAYCDFGDLLQLARKVLKSLPSSLAEQIVENHAEFDNLIAVRNRVMHSRPLEYDDLARTSALFERLLVNGREWPELTSTIKELESHPEFLLRLEIPPTHDSAAVSHNLPLPDFDETGFIGRSDAVKTLHKAIRGAYPVVTIVGEGGLGKTSLALRLAYDLLDARPNPFEAIIFVTAKTAQLTVTEIRRIEGAINTSIGLLQAAAYEFGVLSDSPLEDLISLLEEFRVLLIIDNLETVLDANIRTLLERLPTGSKVVITSRIGLGAFEFPIQLQPLTDAEATQLLRATATVRGCKRLVSMSNSKLAAYCARMRNNPLHIKWFVSAVQVGKRPEEVLSDAKVFLQFCLANVWDKLADEARGLVRVLLSLGGSFTVAELSFLTGLSETNLLRAIQELMRTNMFFMTSTPSGNTFETKYELSQLARAYLNRFYPVNPEEQHRLLGLKKKLVSAGEQIASEGVKNPLSAFSITCRSRSDWVVAKYLREALSATRNQRYDDAMTAIEKAKSLAPEFYEVSRVEAWVHAATGNISAAFDCYERAIELEPSAAKTRMLFGGFLLRDVRDSDAAAHQFREASHLLPKSQEPRIELARCYLYTKDFDAAARVLDELRAIPSLHERASLKLSDLWLQLHARRAEFCLTIQEPLKSLAALEHLRKVYSALSTHDEKMIARVARTRYTALQLRHLLSYSQESSDALDDYILWLDEVRASDEKPDAPEAMEQRLDLFDHGRIVRIHPTGKFGFIRIDGGEEIFFHVSSVTDKQLSVTPTARVKFTITIDWLKRPVAVDVQGE